MASTIRVAESGMRERVEQTDPYGTGSFGLPYRRAVSTNSTLQGSTWRGSAGGQARAGPRRGCRGASRIPPKLRGHGPVAGFVGREVVLVLRGRRGWSRRGPRNFLGDERCGWDAPRDSLPESESWRPSTTSRRSAAGGGRPQRRRRGRGQRRLDWTPGLLPGRGPSRRRWRGCRRGRCGGYIRQVAKPSHTARPASSVRCFYGGW